jgi:osmotically-inducible protein OsmY
MTKTDAQLKQDLEAELDWDPKVNASQVRVTVEKGGVALSGMVDTYGEKWAAEAAAKRVSGVVRSRWAKRSGGRRWRTRAPSRCRRRQVAL